MDLEPGHAFGRAAIRARDTTGIQKQNASAFFISRNVSMTMQHNIDIIRRSFRRDVDEPKLQTFTLKIDNQRPVLIPIAIPADNGERRTDRLEIERDRRLANITQMPDLIGLARKIGNVLRQFVMRVSDNQNAQRIHSRTADGADNADILSANRKIIRLNPRNPRLIPHRVI